MASSLKSSILVVLEKPPKFVESYTGAYGACLIASFRLGTFPNTFPKVLLLDDKIEKSDDYHIGKDRAICLEHTYIANALAQSGLRLYDFVNYYLSKYFSWALVKRYGNSDKLQEWAHRDSGTKQVYETLLCTTDKNTIRFFLENYSKSSKIHRNDKCYCGSDKKLKYCHYNAALFLKATPKQDIIRDIGLFHY
ncbi:MAG TPA: hypothetical protein DIT07_03930 [Sphingobacteriaceae bacterium]|nr:hypothetical protein [Sphingobacteriaceae bacterium]